MQKSIRFASFYLTTFFSRHRRHIFTAFLIGFVITILFINFYPLYVKIAVRRENRIGVVGRFTDSTLPLAIQNQISRGLTQLAGNGEAGPAIASSWEVDEKGTSYIFHLQSNLAWHDGKNFVASDVNYNLKGATFEYPDKYTLKVTLKETYTPLPVLLSKPILKPNLIGLGMYKAVRLHRTADFISELTLAPQDRNLPTLTYKFYPNNQEAILAFKLGEINILQEITDVESLKNWRNVKIREITLYDRFVGVFLNLKNSLFKDKEVRQALIYAIPENADWQKVFTPISPLSWAYSSRIRLYNYDPEATKKLLAKSLIASPSAQLVLSTYPALLPGAQMVADAWNKVGLSVKIKVENSLPADFQMFLMTQAIPPDPDQYQFWQSTQEETNIGSYANQKIDKLLEDGRKTLDKEQRKKIYADFQRYLVDDAPVIFIYYPKVYTLERK